MLCDGDAILVFVSCPLSTADVLTGLIGILTRTPAALG